MTYACRGCLKDPACAVAVTGVLLTYFYRMVATGVVRGAVGGFPIWCGLA